jgi:hypothetical protein
MNSISSNIIVGESTLNIGLRNIHSLLDYKIEAISDTSCMSITAGAKWLNVHEIIVLTDTKLKPTTTSRVQLSPIHSCIHSPTNMGLWGVTLGIHKSLPIIKSSQPTSFIDTPLYGRCAWANIMVGENEEHNIWVFGVYAPDSGKPILETKKIIKH